MSKQIVRYFIITTLILAIVLATNCSRQWEEPENSTKEYDGVIPVVVHLGGLRFDRTDQAVVSEVFQKIQERAPERVLLELADSEEEVRKQDSYTMFIVNYKEESAGSYYLDDQGYYRLGEARDSLYKGSLITCTISVDGKMRWVESQGDYDRDIGDQKISISATTSDYLAAESDKEPEVQLRESAVENLWAKLEQFPTFLDSVVQLKPQFESIPFELSDKFAAVYGGIAGYGGVAGKSGFSTLYINPRSETVPWSPIPFNELSVVEVSGNKVYLCYPGREVGYYCVDTATGAMWQFVAPQIGFWDSLSMRMRVMDVRDGTVYIYYSDKVYALDADSGNKKWVHDYIYKGGDLMPDCPVISGGCLYYGYRGLMHAAPCLVAVDLENGLQKWASSSAAALTWGPKPKGSRVYAIQDALVAFDADTGEVVWSRQPEGTGEYWCRWDVNLEVGCEPLVASGTVFAVERYGQDNIPRLDAYDAETGALKWQASLTAPDGSSSGAPNFYQIMEPIGGIVPVNYDYGVAAFDINTGEKLWTFAKQCSIYFNRATATQNTILVNDGIMLRAIDVSDGKLKWSFQSEITVIGHDAACYLSTYKIWPHYSHPLRLLATGGVVYTTNSSIITALDESTGEERWRCPGGSFKEISDGLIYMEYNMLTYVVGNYLWVIDAATGQFKSCFPLTGRFGEVVDGTVYVTQLQPVVSGEKESWSYYLLGIKPKGS